MAQYPDIKKLMPQIRAARAQWGSPPPTDVTPETPGPGQESVWDYPRPPVIDKAETTIYAYLGNTVVLQSDRALRILETAGAPVYCAPREDWNLDLLTANGEYSVCEWKGVARQYDVKAEGQVAKWGAFSYDEPLNDLGQGYEQLAGCIAPHPAKLTCYLGNEKAEPQPGGMYAGWVTSRIVGPVKGGPGTGHW
jgi:uncharacterized protein (DUF427 family)